MTFQLIQPLLLSALLVATNAREADDAPSRWLRYPAIDDLLKKLPSPTNKESYER